MLKKLEESVEEIVENVFGEKEKVSLEETPSLAIGDFGTSVCFKLAKKLGKKPEEIGKLLIEKIKEIELVKDVKLVNGYLNIFIDRKKALEYILAEKSEKEKNEKIIVEHTSVNPNKAIHVGHLRNSCLGDSLARFLSFLGYKVERENYIDDTGVQVAATLLGFIGKENIDKLNDSKFLDELKKRIEEIESKQKLDIYCWDLYTEVYKKYSEEELEKLLKKVLHEIENPESLFHSFAKWFTERIFLCHLQTLKKIDIFFDFLPRESDIVTLGFWEETFELLKKSENFVYETEGKNKGCWVIKLSRHEAFSSLKDPDKILVRSDGTLTYTAKDIAFHFWKFGFLKKDFYARKLEGFETWVSESLKTNENKKFGKADKVINVIDIRQKYAQDVVRYSLELLGYKKAENLVHYGYEVVALSAKSMEELGKIDKSYIHMSGRKGIGVKADDLILALEKKALEEIEKRHEGLDEKEKERIARAIVTAALRFYMVRQNINKILVFDIDEALEFEGDSGVYLLYSLVRAKNILKRCTKNSLVHEMEDEEWKIVRLLLEFERIVEEAEKSLDLSLLADYSLKLAKAFTEFYHNCKVAGSEREGVRRAIVEAFLKTFSRLLWILGIPEMEKM